MKRPIGQVLQEHTDMLMSIPGVVGTAQGKNAGQPSIRILVVKKTSQLTKQIPSTIEGYSVVIQETGTIRALDQD